MESDRLAAYYRPAEMQGIPGEFTFTYPSKCIFHTTSVQSRCARAMPYRWREQVNARASKPLCLREAPLPSIARRAEAPG